MLSIPLLFHFSLLFFSSYSSPYPFVSLHSSSSPSFFFLYPYNLSQIAAVFTEEKFSHITRNLLLTLGYVPFLVPSLFSFLPFSQFFSSLHFSFLLFSSFLHCSHSFLFLIPSYFSFLPFSHSSIVLLIASLLSFHISPNFIISSLFWFHLFPHFFPLTSSFLHFFSIYFISIRFISPFLIILSLMYTYFPVSSLPCLLPPYHPYCVLLHASMFLWYSRLFFSSLFCPLILSSFNPFLHLSRCLTFFLLTFLPFSSHRHCLPSPSLPVSHLLPTLSSFLFTPPFSPCLFIFSPLFTESFHHHLLVRTDVLTRLIK